MEKYIMECQTTISCYIVYLFFTIIIRPGNQYIYKNIALYF